MIILSVSDASLSFGTDTILSRVSLGVNEGDKIGVVGVNGAGKSLFMKIAAGVVEATEGSVFVAKDKKIGYLEQNTGLDSEGEMFDEMLLAFPSLIKQEERLSQLMALMESQCSENEHMMYAKEYTTLEEKFKKDGGYEYKSRISSMLVNLGFSKETHSMKINTLSGGQKTRLALARLLLSNPDILMLDEPTNHLDIQTCEWLEEYLKVYKKSLIVISHDRYFLDKVTRYTFEIENQEGRLYTCPYSEYVIRKEQDQKVDQKHYEIQQKEIARLEAFIENQRKWNRERNIIAAESRIKAIDRMEKIQKPKDSPSNIKFSFQMRENGKCPERMLEVSDLSKSFDEKQLFSNVSFILHGKDRMFIVGQNGVGKSTMLKILCGKVGQDFGTFEYAKGLSIGYYDQEHQGLNPNNTVIDELWDCFPDKTQTQIRSALAGFLFTSDDVFKKVSVLSGGEKARLTFAKLMLERNDMIVLDEPTNHLDAPSREVLENALVDFDGTMLCVSHDRYFINKLASRVFEMKQDGVFDFMGNYEDFVAYKQKTSSEQNRNVQKSESISLQNNDYAKNKEARNLKRNTQKKLADTEKTIAQLEQELEDVAQMQEESASDYQEQARLYERVQTVQEQLNQLYELWVQLQEKIEEIQD